MTATKVPMRLSPLHALHLETGAVMSDVAGWQVVQRYGDVEGELSAVMESAGVCDISGRTAVRIKSSQLDDVLGERSPAVGMIIKNGDSVIARLTREEALVFGPSSAVGNYPAGVEPDGDPVRYLTDVTSGLTGLKIAGPRARDVIAALTDIDLRDRAMPDSSCAQAGFAKVHGTLLRLDFADTVSYELYVAREYGAYVWEVILESLGKNAVIAFSHQPLKRLEQGQGG